MVLIPRHDELGVGKPVEVRNHERADALLSGKRERHSLRAAAHRASHVQGSCFEVKLEFWES
jgi:hypothetical protein